MFFLILAIIVILGLLIWAIFNPIIPGYIYIGLYITLSIYCIIVTRKQKDIKKEGWTSYEVGLISEYYLALTAYYGAKLFSTVLNTFRWMGALWMILFFIYGMWFHGGFMIVAFFATFVASLRLDPFTALQSGSKKNPQMALKLEALSSIFQKINGPQ